MLHVLICMYKQCAPCMMFSLHIHCAMSFYMYMYMLHTHTHTHTLTHTFRISYLDLYSVIPPLLVMWDRDLKHRLSSWSTSLSSVPAILLSYTSILLSKKFKSR